MQSKDKKDMTYHEDLQDTIETNSMYLSTCSVLAVVGHLVFHLGFIMTGNILVGLAIIGLGTILIKSYFNKKRLNSETTEDLINPEYSVA